jgi:hypothetical protein
MPTKGFAKMSKEKIAWVVIVTCPNCGTRSKHDILKENVY